jgi:hypothetical protein
MDDIMGKDPTTLPVARNIARVKLKMIISLYRFYSTQKIM